MGMGFAAAYADVFPTDKVEELCPDEYAGLLRAAAENLDGELDEDTSAEDTLRFAVTEYLQFEGGETDAPEAIQQAWRALCAKFEAVTGLTLAVGYHDSEDAGSRYDEVGGLYFAVDGMYQLSPAGERWRDVVQRKQFVTFG